VRTHIAHYKAPRSVEFRSSLPKSGIQKTLRRELREDAFRSAGVPDPLAAARRSPRS
jgi:acyl-CoA synthetase (AMP-forming)/AMP-acid ligase II